MGCIFFKVGSLPSFLLTSFIWESIKDAEIQEAICPQGRLFANICFSSTKVMLSERGKGTLCKHITGSPFMRAALGTNV